VNRLYWRLGEELPKTGTPSERFGSVRHSATGTLVDQIVSFVVNLSAEYAQKHDPWHADTVCISKSFENRLSNDGFLELESALEQLGMILLFDPELPGER